MCLMNHEYILNERSRENLRPLMEIVGARLNDENSLTFKMRKAYMKCGKVAVVNETINTSSGK